MYMCEDLGYDDMDEFEDALNGTFVDFLKSLPHCKVFEKDGIKINCISTCIACSGFFVVFVIVML